MKSFPRFQTFERSIHIIKTFLLNESLYNDIEPRLQSPLHDIVLSIRHMTEPSTSHGYQYDIELNMMKQDLT
jgi:hypothetical protein